MIKVNENDVTIEIIDIDITLMEFSVLLHGLYLTLEKSYPDKIKEFKKILKYGTDKNNFIIGSMESKTERRWVKCDL